MTKTIGSMRKLGLATAISGLALGAGVVNAADFDVTAEVQNTLEVTQVQPMTWGTLFATSANGDAVAGLVMAPNGEITTTVETIDGTADDAPTLISLGGAAPARGSVSSNNNNFTLTVPDFALTEAGAEVSDFSEDNAVELRIEGGDPDVARFYMVDFTVGDADDATITAGAEANEHVFDPNFGVEAVEFGIGATIYTDGGADDTAGAETRVDYEQGTYSGEFEVTASY